MACPMKRLVLIITLLVIFSFTFVSFGEELVKGVVVANDVNIRIDANIEAVTMGSLKLGNYITIIDSKDDWYNIQLDDGLTGWVYMDLIVPVNSENDFPKKGLITGDNVNLREQPHLESSILRQMSKDSEISIIEELNEWYKISTSEETVGWVHSDLVQLKLKYSTGQIIGSSVNLRSTPSLSGSILTKLELNHYVSIKDYVEGWYNVITVNETEGWVYKDFVSVVINSNSNKLEVSRSSTSRSIADLGVLDFARKYLGTPYKWAANGPNNFDCSGFTTYVYNEFGIRLPRRSVDQAKVGEKVTKDSLSEGDLVFFDTSGANDGKITHVGIYIGSGEFIHASSGKSAKKVIISSLWEGYYKEKYVTARRVL